MRRCSVMAAMICKAPCLAQFMGKFEVLAD
jgi:hypothetical protein